MMKKFLVLALVCGLASLASAGFTWDITGASGAAGEIYSGDVLTIKLMSTVKYPGIVVDLLTDNGADGVISGVVTPGVWGEGQVGMDAADFDAFLVSEGAPAQGLAAGDWAFLSSFGSNAAAFVDGAILTFNYTAGSAGDVVINGAGITLLGGNNYIGQPGGPNMPELSFTVVPEPATMALLGLGALVLRRRK